MVGSGSLSESEIFAGEFCSSWVCFFVRMSRFFMSGHYIPFFSSPALFMEVFSLFILFLVNITKIVILVFFFLIYYDMRLESGNKFDI